MIKGKLFTYLWTSRSFTLIAAIEFWEMTRFNFFKKKIKNNIIPDNINYEFEPIIDRLVKNINNTAKTIVYNEKGKKESKILKKLAQVYDDGYYG